MAKKLAPMGLLRAGRVYSLYDVCEHVAKQILDEPKRLDMGWWVSLYKGVSHHMPTASREAYEQGRGPACGTAACIAGWIGLNLRLPPLAIGGRIQRQFGMDPDSVVIREDFERLFGDVWSTHFYGSKAYAREYARKLRTLMKAHSVELQSRRVRVTTNGPVPVA